MMALGSIGVPWIVAISVTTAGCASFFDARAQYSAGWRHGRIERIVGRDDRPATYVPDSWAHCRKEATSAIDTRFAVVRRSLSVANCPSVLASSRSRARFRPEA